jgi:carbamoyltransferase
MLLLGLGGLGRNAAAAIARDGVLLAAVEQKKVAHSAAASGPLPNEAIAACLQLAGANRDAVELVAVARPFAAETALHLALRTSFPNARIFIAEHHTAHAAAAYYLSPFDQATVLTLDNRGDFRCGARWAATGTELHLQRDAYFPDSVGAVTAPMPTNTSCNGCRRRALLSTPICSRRL